MLLLLCVLVLPLLTVDSLGHDDDPPELSELVLGHDDALGLEEALEPLLMLDCVLAPLKLLRLDPLPPLLRLLTLEPLPEL